MASSSSSERAKVVPTRRICRCLLSSDIIMWEILPWLPVKTLCKFRCVSKSWYHLLSSNPDFLQLHRRRSEQKPPTLLVITPDYDANRFPFFTMKMEDGERRVAGSGAFHMRRSLRTKVSACRGLVLVYTPYKLRVWNPATGERIDIDVPAPILTAGNIDPLAFAGDILSMDIVATIGHVESTGEYKVLIFHMHYGMSWQVLTIGSLGGWRTTKNPTAPFTLFFPRDVTCNIAIVNGFIHVLPVYTSDGIARFDLEKEEWSVIPGIDSCHLATKYEYYNFLLREVNGFLCLVQFKESRCLADIWFLKEDIWVKEYTIDLSYYSYLRRGRRMGYMVEPLMIEEDGRILFTSTDLNIFFYYDPKGKSFQQIYKRDEEKLSLMLSTLYKESFASLKRGKIGHIGRCPAL